MAIQLRSSRESDKQETLDLLHTLIETPPSRSDSRLTPVTLRSIDEQRDHALKGFLRRTWVDGALKYAEWLLVIAALALFGFWLSDGPLRDWQHSQAQANTLSSDVEPTPTAVSEPGQAALLPFITQDMAASEPSDDFIVPRQPSAAINITTHPTRLLIPAIGLDTSIEEVFVVDGVWEVAEYAAGFLHGAALPGDTGNMALAGHAGMRGAVFRNLHVLQPGNDIYVDAGKWRYQYRVRSSTAVWPTQVEVLDPTETPVLTLITCTNWDTQRLVVVADLIDSFPSPDA